MDKRSMRFTVAGTLARTMLVLAIFMVGPVLCFAYHDDKPWVPIQINKNELPGRLIDAVSFMLDARNADKIELFHTYLPSDISIDLYRLTGPLVCDNNICPHVVSVGNGEKTHFTIIWSEDVVRTNYEWHHGRGLLHQAIQFIGSQNRTAILIANDGTISVSTY